MDKGDLISLITSDIELLEVYYAHTVFPIAIVALTTIVMVSFIDMSTYVLDSIYGIDSMDKVQSAWKQ